MKKLAHNDKVKKSYKEIAHEYDLKIFMLHWGIKNEMQDAINKTIAKIQKLGYSCNSSEISHSKSCYITVYENGDPLFKLRLSNHDLEGQNQMPAGVINQSYVLIDTPMLMSQIRYYLKKISKMSNEDKEIL